MTPEKIHTQLEQRLKTTKSPWDKLPLLTELSQLTLHRKPSRSYNAAMEVLHIGKSLKDSYWTATGHLLAGTNLTLKDCCSDAQFHLEIASDVFGDVGDLSMQCKAHHALGKLCLRVRDFEKAEEVGQKNLLHFQTINNKLWVTHTLSLLGETYYIEGRYAESRMYLRKALWNAKRYKLRTCLAQLYYSLAQTVYETGEWNTCKDYYQKSLSFAKAHQNKFEQGKAYAAIAGFYLDAKDPVAAKKSVKKAIAVFRDLDFPGYLGSAVGTYSTSCIATQSAEQGMRYEEETIQLFSQTDNPVHIALVQLNIGKRYFQQDQPEQSIPYLLKAIDLLAPLRLHRYHFLSCQILSHAYERIGETEKALHYYKLYTEKQAETIGVERMNAIKDGEIKWATRISRAKSKKQKHMIATLTADLQRKEKDVLSLALQLTERSEELAKLKQTPLNGKSLQETQRNNWETFAQQFYVVHRGFYSNLVRTYPELTSSELKVCCLIRIGLSSKEIASLLHVSSRTVDSHRERIRKKLPLPPRYALASFIKAM